jgi:hypothetical protein
MRYAIKLCGGATIFAILLIGTGYVLRGSPAKEWVHAAIYLAMGMFYAYGIFVMPRCEMAREGCQGQRS